RTHVSGASDHALMGIRKNVLQLVHDRACGRWAPLARDESRGYADASIVADGIREMRDQLELRANLTNRRDDALSCARGHRPPPQPPTPVTHVHTSRTVLPPASERGSQSLTDRRNLLPFGHSARESQQVESHRLDQR